MWKASGPLFQGTIRYGQNPPGWHTIDDAQPLRLGVTYEALVGKAYAEFLMIQAADGEVSIVNTN